MDHTVQRQHPQCEGFNKNRILFSNESSSGQRHDLTVYNVLTEDNTYALDAGEVLGITDGSTFNIYADKPLTQFLGQFLADTVSVATTDLIKVHERPIDTPIASSSSGPVRAYAVQTGAGKDDERELTVLVDKDLTEIRTRVENETKMSMRLGRLRITLLDTDSSSPGPFRLTLVSKGDEVTLHTSIDDVTCSAQGITLISVHESVRRHEIDKILNLISRAADIAFHLTRTSTLTNRLDDYEHIYLECFELQLVHNPRKGMKRIGVKMPRVNLIANGALNVATDDNKIYGFNIVNNTDTPLYVALFYFGMSDLTISKLSFHCLNV